jgi:hypothetical protein
LVETPTAVAVMLNGPAPRPYCHYQLQLDSYGEKLANSKDPASLKSLREAGEPPPAALRRRLGVE